MSWQASTLGEVLARQASGRGASEALVTDHARLTYAQLFDQARQVAAGLRAMGLAKGDHVAILMGNDAAWIQLFYGAAILPVNTLALFALVTGVGRVGVAQCGVC